VAGYSGTPLPRKLGIRDGARVVLLDAPTDLLPHLLPDLPDDVSVSDRPEGHADVVVAFFTERAELEQQVEPLGRLVFPAGGLWVAWPKRASGVPTDITEDVVREVALPLGLVDNKVCAIDETWSGLRVVWRRERR
jgi:hypothetical protein